LKTLYDVKKGEKQKRYVFQKSKPNFLIIYKIKYKTKHIESNMNDCNIFALPKMGNKVK